MSRWTRRALIAAPILAAAVVAGAPYLSADPFKDQIRLNLENVLHRRVEVQGEARFQLYPRPGISLSRVVIHELPEYGVEPIAYLDYPESSLDVSLAPLPLLLGRIRVSSVRLVAPSVNLTKTADGVWTFQPLLDHALGEGRSGAGFDLDALEIRGGRLNVKIGNVKSVFYLADTDVRVEADSSNRARYGITIEGDPARTDRTVSSFGRLSGRGMLTLGQASAESRIDLNLSIDRTPISELVTALEGRSAGFGGFVASQAKLSGPLSAVDIEGRILLNEAERFGWLLPRALSSRGLAYSGRLDWPGQELRLSTREAEAGGGDPLTLRMRAADLFRQPHWAVLMGINRAPLASVRAMAGELGMSLPSTAPVEGSLSGVLGYSSRHGTRGQLEITDAAVPIPKLPTIKLAAARVLVDNDRWRVPPAEIRFSDRESVTVETAGDAASGSRNVAVTSVGMGVERSRQLWKFLAGGTDPPFFDRCGQGQWAGTIRFEQDGQGAGAWNGDVRIGGAVCTIDGVADPGMIESAQVSMRGPAMFARRVAARVGALRIFGEVDHDPRLRRHTRLTLMASEAPAGEIERLLLPALQRERGFFSRTLGRRAVLPEWLSQRRLDARIRIAALTFDSQRVEGFDASVAWDGPLIAVRRFSATAVGGGAVTGSFRIGLTDSEPRYSGQATAADLAIREGKVDASAEWEAAGVGGSRLLAGLQAQGRFSVSGNPWASAEPPCESAAGMFSLEAGRLLVTNLQMSSGGESWQGRAMAGTDGRLQFELSAPGEPSRQLRAAGRLW